MAAYPASDSGSDSDSDSDSSSSVSPFSPNVKSPMSSDLGSPDLVEVRTPTPHKSSSSSGSSSQEVEALELGSPLSPAESGIEVLEANSDSSKSGSDSGSDSESSQKVIEEQLSPLSLREESKVLSLEEDDSSSSSSSEGIQLQSPLSAQESPLVFQEGIKSPLSPQSNLSFREASEAASPKLSTESPVTPREIKSPPARPSSVAGSRKSSARSHRSTGSSIIEVSEEDTPHHHSQIAALVSPLTMSLSNSPVQSMQSLPVRRPPLHPSSSTEGSDSDGDSDICVPVKQVEATVKRSTREPLPPPERQKRTSVPMKQNRQEQKLYLKKEKPPPPSPEKSKNTKSKEDIKKGVEKTMQRMAEREKKIVSRWVQDMLEGNEVRMTRKLVPLAAAGKKGQEDRCLEDLTVSEGSTGCIVQGKLINYEHGLVPDSKTLINVNAGSGGPLTLASVYVWVRAACGTVLLRADSLAVIATADEEFLQGKAKGPVLLGRQQAWLALSERNTDIKARPKWERAKGAPKLHVDHLKVSYPQGSYVSIDGAGEGVVKGHRRDEDSNTEKVIVGIDGSLRLCDPHKLTLLKKKYYSLVSIAGPEFTSGQLDAKRETAAERKKLAKKEKIDEDEKSLAKMKTLETEKLNMMVNRLQGYRTESRAPSVVDKCGSIKCQDKSWATKEKQQMRRDEVQQVERAKRRANPTYDAMMNWKEEWDRSQSHSSHS